MNFKKSLAAALSVAKEVTQKLAEKRNLKIKDIVLIPEFLFSASFCVASFAKLSAAASDFLKFI